MLCPKCGINNDVDAVFCIECGFKLNYHSSVGKSKKNSEVSPVTELIGWISAFIFAPLGLVIGLYLIHTEPDDKGYWFIFGISFIVCFLAIFITFISIASSLGYMSDLMPRMRVY